MAASWYRKAADKGNAPAMSNLGELYRSGVPGIEKNAAQSALWYQKAAENGDPNGMYVLGWKYESGDGVMLSHSKAVHWYHQGARRGNDYAMTGLGGMYQSGRGVPQNYATAANWYKRAIPLGNVKATMLLGDLYAKGKGVPRDLRIAKSLYALASKSSRRSIWTGEAKERLTRLEQQEDTGDIVAGVLVAIGAYLVADYLLGDQSNTSSENQNESERTTRVIEQQRQIDMEKVRYANWETNCSLSGGTPVNGICM